MIRMTVNGSEARCETTRPLTSGSVGLAVSFLFSDDWLGLSPIAVFKGSGTAADVALLTDDCTVPAEVLAAAGGSLWIGVYGQSGDGETVIPTVWAKAGYIEEGSAPSGVDPAASSPSWSAQVQAAAAEALEKAAAVEAAALRGDFDGADGRTPVKGTDYFTPEELAAFAASVAELVPELTPAVVTLSAPTALTLADNTEYYLSEVSSLTLSYPSAAHWSCVLLLTTAASGTITVTLPESEYIGSAPEIGNGETWELSFHDGVVVAGKCEAAT